MSSSATAMKTVFHAVKDTMISLLGETHDYANNMSPRNQMMALYATCLGSAITTSLILSYGSNPFSRTHTDTTTTTATRTTILKGGFKKQPELKKIPTKRTKGYAEGSSIVVPPSPPSVLDFEVELLMANKTSTAAVDDSLKNENEEIETSKQSILDEAARATNTPTETVEASEELTLKPEIEKEDDVIFEQSGSLGTYYVVGEKRPTPKQQLNNLLENMNNESRNAKPCPPSFRKKNQEQDGYGDDDEEEDYRLLSNRAYYPTAMSKASTSVTKSWVHTRNRDKSRFRSSNDSNNSSSSNTTNDIASTSNFTAPSKVTRKSNDNSNSSKSYRFLRGSSSLSGSRTPSNLVSKARANNNRVPLPSPSMNGMRTRDQHLSYDGKNTGIKSSVRNVSMDTTRMQQPTPVSKSRAMSSTPSPSLPVGRTSSTRRTNNRTAFNRTPSTSRTPSSRTLIHSSLQSRPAGGLSSPSPASPSPRSRSSAAATPSARRMGSVLGPNRAASTGVPSKIGNKAISIINAGKENQLERIKFEIKDQGLAATSNNLPSIMEWAEAADNQAQISSIASTKATTTTASASTNILSKKDTPSQPMFSSPMKQSLPAASMSPSPPKREVNRTLSYTPAKLPSTMNSSINSVML